MNEKFISKWEDFDEAETESIYIDCWVGFMDICRIYQQKPLLRIFRDLTTIPEAILILNALGFNFRLEEA